MTVYLIQDFCLPYSYIFFDEHRENKVEKVKDKL